MVITAVKQLKNGRYGLFEGENFIFSLDADTYLDCGVCAGEELNEEELERLKAIVDAKKAKEKALTLLSYRDHSRQELKRKLMRTADEDAADAAADKMEELGLINDEQFAQKFAGELFQNKAYGKSKVIYEMTKRGLDRELVCSVVEALDDDPVARALRFLQKKYPRGIADETARRRACAALSRCGYTWEDQKQALKNYGMDEQDAD
jgi:regulatory protein